MRYKNRSTLVILVLRIVVGLSLGCTKAGDGAPTGDQVTTIDSLSAASCSPTAPALNAGSVGIVGSQSVAVGSSVNYKLNQPINCNDAAMIAWSAGASASQEGAKFKYTFSQPGVYVVSAQIPAATTNLSKGVSKAASSDSSDSGELVVAYKTTVVGESAMVIGPEIAMQNEFVTYDVGVPNGKTATSAVWNFGDGSPTVSSLSPVNYVFSKLGAMNVSVKVTYSDSSTETATQSVYVVSANDGLQCVSAVTISAPSQAQAGVPSTFSAYLPACLSPVVSDVRWNFGETPSTVAGQVVNYAYALGGDFTVTLKIYTSFSGGAPWLILQRKIHVLDPIPEPSPTPTPIATPTPPPVDPKACPMAGLTRASYSGATSHREVCGLDGTKLITTREKVTEECKLAGEGLRWIEVSRAQEILSQGECEGQSCQMVDGTVLKNGSTSIGVVVGELKTPVQCEFGETGVFNLYDQVADYTCSNGSLSSSDPRQGANRTMGVCPTYSWVATETWTACSMDCGGTQSQVYACHNNLGMDASSERCKDAVPVVTRVCDGNPEAVRRTDRVMTEEDGGETHVCPKNQIGVTVKHRDVTTVLNYACLDHAVQLESQSTEYGPWQSESYCRDYVPHRCSQDSLNVTQAKARYAWMQKCRSKVPAIEEFLSAFDDVEVGSGKSKFSLESDRPMYATFMNRATKPEKPWIAPKVDSGACEVPSTAYIAAVCVSSCATPEMRILAQEDRSAPMRPTQFVDALTKKSQYVTSLHSASSMKSHSTERTKVESWVTELIDTEHDILEFRMVSGRLLRLTPNHPVLAEDGTMKVAAKFAVGDRLVRLGGKLEPIVSITPVKHFGKVYNLFVKSNDLKKNIVVTEGYLNGTAYFQNEGSDQLNRQVMQKQLIRGVFEK